MEIHKIETYYLLKPQTDWRIRDYKVRILNKINKQKRETREKYARLKDIERLVSLTMKRFRLSEFDALQMINKELTLKEISNYGNERIKSY